MGFRAFCMFQWLYYANSHSCSPMSILLCKLMNIAWPCEHRTYEFYTRTPKSSNQISYNKYSVLIGYFSRMNIKMASKSLCPDLRLYVSQKTVAQICFLLGVKTSAHYNVIGGGGYQSDHIFNKNCTEHEMKNNKSVDPLLFDTHVFLVDFITIS